MTPSGLPLTSVCGFSPVPARYEPAAMASSMVRTGLSSSYCTSTARAPRRAAASLSATTSPITAPTHGTAVPTATKHCSSCTTGPIALLPGTSSAPKYPSTPSIASALVGSTASSFACGRSESTGYAKRHPAGYGTSSTYCASPVTCISAATCTRSWPTSWVPSIGGAHEGSPVHACRGTLPAADCSSARARPPKSTTEDSGSSRLTLA
mmetsp:Transcript_5750/g.22703  ORF Transcript_5750/g.22703 Transcript_5750/m.22703 type:complete len:209 (+) Transcript_5750:2336-2962(+)